jgi:hypothetical protein
MGFSNYNYSPSIVLDKAGGWVQAFLSRRHWMMDAAVQPVVIPTGSIPTRFNSGRTLPNRNTFLAVPAGVVQFHQATLAGRQSMIGPNEIAQQQSNVLLSNLQDVQNRFYGKA